MNKDKLSEILSALISKSGSKAVFVFSVSDSNARLAGFEFGDEDSYKYFNPEIDKDYKLAFLNKADGFYKNSGLVHPVEYSINNEKLLLHLFSESGKADSAKLEEILTDFSQKIAKSYNFRKYSSLMKYSDYFDFAVILKDFHGNVKYCNGKSTDMFKGGFEEFNNANKAYLEYFDVKIQEDFNRHHDNSISKGESEIILNSAGENLKRYRLNSKLIKEENLILDVLIPLSVEQKTGDDFQGKFRELVEAYNDLAFFLDRNGYFQVINSNGAHLLGYKIEDVIGRHFLEFVSDEDKAEIALTFQNILTSRKYLPFEARLQDSYSNKIVFQIFGNTVYSENKISGYLGFGKDLSKILSMEEKINQLNAKLIEANRLISIEKDRAREQMNVLEEINKLKNEFISTISHELRTPLASIVGFAETIISDNSLPVDMIHEFTGIILSEGKRLAKLVNDILDFSKLESIENPLNIEEFDLIFLLKELVGNFKSAASEKNININTEIPEAEIFISADKEKITKAISVILSNAIKYNNPDGRVTIIVKDFLNEFEVIVIDTGIGISEKEIPKLFQKFSKIQTNAQNQGPGFGLVTAKQIIDMHKGIIRVKSEENKGSTFIVRLPKK